MLVLLQRQTSVVFAPVNDVALMEVLEREEYAGRIELRGRCCEASSGRLLQVTEQLAAWDVPHQHVHARRVAVHGMPAWARTCSQHACTGALQYQHVHARRVTVHRMPACARTCSQHACTEVLQAHRLQQMRNNVNMSMYTRTAYLCTACLHVRTHVHSMHELQHCSNYSNKSTAGTMCCCRLLRLPPGLRSQ